MSKIKDCLSVACGIYLLFGIGWGVWSFVHWIDYQATLEGCNNSLPYGVDCTCKEGTYTIVCSKQVETSNSWTTMTQTIIEIKEGDLNDFFS